jgi:hypothetical protein
MVTRRINSPNDHIQHPTGSSAYIRYPQALTARLLPPPSPLTNTLPYYRQQYGTRPGPLRHSHTRPCPPFFFLFSSRRGGRGQELYQTWTTLLNWRPHTCLHASSPCFSPFPKLLDPFIALPCLGFYRETPEHMLPAGVQEESELTFVKKAL